MQKIRCAIYTRKSSEDGLEQEFNSLDAQREACAAYVQSQKAEGWVLLPELYDDGGLSGGTLERPALKRLLAAIDEGLVDQIIVYKIDRLTRSLADFSKIVDRLDAAEASFVSVTQSFNTATSMGRLTLNMLLSFAQFEREVTAERIRDKIAASKRKGLWMGGNVPLGYDADGRTLAVNKAEASIIRQLYDLYLTHGTIRDVKFKADALKLRSRKRISPSGKKSGGNAFDRGHIYHILTNPIYAGRIRHKGLVFEGQHPAIINPVTWDQVQVELQGNAARQRTAGARGATKGRPQVSLLCGKIFDETGDRLTPSHSKTRKGRRLRYYVSHRLIKRSGEKDVSGWRLPAPQLEKLVADQVRKTMAAPAFVSKLVTEVSSGEVVSMQMAIQNMLGAPDKVETRRSQILKQVGRTDLSPGNVRIVLDPTRIADLLTIPADRIDQEALTIIAAFQHRRRGVETKLVLSDAPPDRDEVLLKNVALGHIWFERIKAGQTYEDIAICAGVSKRRVMQVVDLAFLAPNIVSQMLQGKQPTGLTSDYLIKRGLPDNWDKQRRVIAYL
jgi:site-specific DNA recombinase